MQNQPISPLACAQTQLPTQTPYSFSLWHGSDGGVGGSSVSPSQSLSTPSQISGAPG